MRLSVTLVAADPSRLAAAQERLEMALSDQGETASEARLLGPHALDLELEAEEIAPVRAAAEAGLDGFAADVCVQPAKGRRKLLLIADMDSTIIGCECIDELADLVGLKAMWRPLPSGRCAATSASRAHCVSGWPC
jgi:phosphoserine phosphatase